MAGECAGPTDRPGPDHFIVFFGKTLNSHSASLKPSVYKWVPANLMLVENPVINQHLIQE